MVEVIPGKDGKSDTVMVCVSLEVCDKTLDFSDQMARKALPKYMAMAGQVAGALLDMGSYDGFHVWENDTYENRRNLADHILNILIGPQAPQGQETEGGPTTIHIIPEEAEESDAN